MDQFRKFGLVVALGPLLATAAPALAGACHRAIVSRPCHAGCGAHGERPVHSAQTFAAVGIIASYIPPGPFPVGYDGSSATPTGYGVIYNVPPPRILTVNRPPDFPRENGVIVIRGGAVSAAY
jgi:hypothetical protein